MLDSMCTGRPPGSAGRRLERQRAGWPCPGGGRPPQLSSPPGPLGSAQQGPSPPAQPQGARAGRARRRGRAQAHGALPATPRARSRRAGGGPRPRALIGRPCLSRSRGVELCAHRRRHGPGEVASPRMRFEAPQPAGELGAKAGFVLALRSLTPLPPWPGRSFCLDFVPVPLPFRCQCCMTHRWP